nr:AP-1 complex subunit gamma-1-like [Aedes albopictus]
MTASSSSSPKDKRIGDLNSSTQFVVSLGVIESPEMARDLTSVIEKNWCGHWLHHNKAALFAFWMLKSVPELMDIFLPATQPQLHEKNNNRYHISGVSLLTEIREASRDMQNHF